MASRPSTRIAFLALLVFLWSWPSLFFLPVVLGRDSTGLSLTSAFLTVGIGVVVVSASMLVAGRGETRSWMIYCSIGVAVGIFVIVIPSYLLGVEAGVLGGLGGTRGEAIDIALERLFAGQYPYSMTTSDQQPLTPLPGGLLLAIPAKAALGSAAFLAAYVLTIGILLVSIADRLAAGILGIALVAAPALWTDYLSEGDLVATSFLAFALGLMVLRSAMNEVSVSRWLWPIGLGVVGATRVTTLVVAALAAALVMNGGRNRIALIQLFESVAVFLLLSVPFYIWSPDEFSPLHVSRFAKNHLGFFLVLVATVLLLVWLVKSSWMSRTPPAAQLALACSTFAFLVTALPMIASLDTRADTGELLSGYAVLALVAPVGVLALRSSDSTGAQREKVGY